MTTNERRNIYFRALTADTQLCVNCEHFYRHYNQKGWPLHCGHCVYPRFKHRDTWDTCEKFEHKAEAKTTIFKEAN